MNRKRAQFATEEGMNIFSVAFSAKTRTKKGYYPGVPLDVAAQEAHALGNDIYDLLVRTGSYAHLVSDESIARPRISRYPFHSQPLREIIGYEGDTPTTRVIVRAVKNMPPTEVRTNGCLTRTEYLDMGENQYSAVAWMDYAFSPENPEDNGDPQIVTPTLEAVTKALLGRFTFREMVDDGQYTIPQGKGHAISGLLADDSAIVNMFGGMALNFIGSLGSAKVPAYKVFE